MAPKDTDPDNEKMDSLSVSLGGLRYDSTKEQLDALDTDQMPRKRYNATSGRPDVNDPIGDRGGDSDWYGYCLDDPVNEIDPLGLFRFGKKGLWILPGIGTDGSTADKRNYELKHEHGFYEDGTGDNVGLFKDGPRRDQDITKYKLDETHFDDKRMRQAEESLDPGDYKLCKWGGKSNNCQD